MSLLRTDGEACLQDLLVACRETVDLYRDAAGQVDDPAVQSTLRSVVGEREPFVARIESAVETLGDLPARPDADKETVEMMLNHLRASLSPDSTAQLIEQRLETEQYLAQLIEQARQADLDDGESLLDELSDHVHQTRERLQGVIGGE